MRTTLWRFIQTGGENLAELLSFLVAIVIAITVHEYAHAKAAQRAGDPTPEQAGRVTLNPLVHFDIIGTIMLLFAGFGWGKPVPVNPAFFRRPRIDDILVSLWGPLSNFIAAAVFAIPLKFRFAGEYAIVLDIIVWMNLVLGLFNLIPIYPLDGSHILSGLLPVEQARRLDEFYHRFGMLLLILIIVTRVTTYIVGIPVMILHGLLTGPVILGLVPPRSRSQIARPRHSRRRAEGKGQSRR
jgi:Zn-dependent protease